VPEDSIEEAGTMGEEEEAKHRRRDRQNDPSLVRHRTNKSSKSWAVTRLKAQRPLGEWLGMTIFTFVGISSNLAAVTSSNEAGTMETQYWAWGFATMIGKFVHAITFHTRNAIVSLLIWNQVYISPAAAAVPSSTQPW
jgi:hypothetical protein